MEREQQEQEAVDGVLQRMTERFPDVPSEVIERTVHEMHEELSGPIRDFVPVLVEHRARDHFEAMTRQPA
jgi:hypothetical protein